MQFDTQFRKPDCHKCLDVGMVELSAPGAPKVLAKCACEMGKTICWKLPTAPMKGFSEHPVDSKEFMPNSKVRERMALIRERVELSEQFWAEVETEIAAQKKQHTNVLADW